MRSLPSAHGLYVTSIIAHGMHQASIYATGQGHGHHAAHREKFIEEQLRKRLGKKGDSEADEQDRNGNNEEHDLYTIPPHLQVYLYFKKP